MPLLKAKKDKRIYIVIALVVIALVYFFVSNSLNEESAVDVNDKIKRNEGIECNPEQRNVDFCIEIYQPVCATVNIQCITTPCDPIKETFSNSCKACTNKLVSSYTHGKCLVDQ
jgi:hypothetical protein